MAEPDGFHQFVTARSPGLVRAAWLLTGNSATAEDLVQTALAKVWVRWSRIDRHDAPEAYARRVMLSTFLSWQRRRWHGEIPAADLPDTHPAVSELHGVELRWSIARSLRSLPRRQRAVVVLRYFEDLTEAEVARVMGCSVGTVKSQNAKAIARLRSDPHLAALFDATEEAISDRP